MNKIFDNKEVRKSTVILIIITSLFVLIQSLLYKTYLNNQKKDYIEIIGSVLHKTREVNPELEKEIMPLITKELSKEDKEVARSILSEYSITTELDNNLFPNFKKNKMIIILSILFSVLIIILNYIQHKFYFRKVRNITLAANKILDEDYSMIIKEDGEGDFSKLAIAFRDVRDVINNNVLTIQSEKKYLVELLQNISHQLKTKIQTLMLYNDILLYRNLSEDKKLEFLNDNKKQLNNMNLMIQNILKLARLDAEAIEFYKKEKNINETVKEVMYSLKDFAKENKVKLFVSSDEKITISHDKFWIKEALGNIIKNCIEHSVSSGEVEIELLDNPVYSKIIIKDTGEGISEDDIANIFKRFYKSKKASKKDSVGIGLAISKSIIESHNGYIDVKSIKGQGTSFIITFMKY